MEKKLAVAVSIVNMLNSIAPVALPYVELAQNVNKEAQNHNYAEAIQGACYGRAYAAEQTVTNGETSSWTENGGTMVSSDKQTVTASGTGGTAIGTVETMDGGTQTVFASNGGTASGTVTTMYGGVQIVSSGGAQICPALGQCNGLDGQRHGY